MFSEDLLVLILVSLPVKTLARCLIVSKFWASIIRSRRFIELYQCTREPYVTFAFRDTLTFSRWHFVSPYQPPSFVTNATSCIDTSGFRRPDCVNGLICVEYMHCLWICNPVTGKCLLLPPSSTRKPFTTWFLGYDPINYQYKVLFLSKDSLSGPYTVEVFTLLVGGQVSLKMIEDGNIEAPTTRGICINGVLYYGAETADGPRFKGFDVRTEKFVKTIEIPAEACGIYGTYLGFYALLNYEGKLALLAAKTVSIYDLWVLEDDEKQDWSRVSHVITREMCPFDLTWPGLVGFVPGSGELIVTARDHSYGQLHLVYVDLEKKRSRQVLFQGTRCSYQSSMVLAFTDYVESIVLL